MFAHKLQYATSLPQACRAAEVTHKQAVDARFVRRLFGVLQMRCNHVPPFVGSRVDLILRSEMPLSKFQHNQAAREGSKAMRLGAKKFNI